MAIGRYLWQKIAIPIVIPAGVIVAGMLLFQSYQEYPRQMFDRGYYRRIAEGMSLEEVQAVLEHPVGDYRPWTKGIDWSKRTWVSKQPLEAKIIEEHRWAATNGRERYTTCKCWWGPEWMIAVEFDDFGKAVRKELFKVDPSKAPAAQSVTDLVVE